MGRPKGSKNVVRQVPVKISKEVDETSGPELDELILGMYRSRYYSACIESIDHYIEDKCNISENMSPYKVLQAAAFIQLGDQFKEAHQVLDEVIAADPTYASAYFNKGVAFFCQKKYEPSLAMLEKALSLNPKGEMERVTYFKMRIDCNRRSVKVVIEKLKFEHEDYNGNLIKRIKLENPEDSISDYDFKGNNFSSDSKDEDNSYIADLCLNPFTGRLNEFKPLIFIPEGLPQGFVPVTARDFFAKGSELYSVGMLKAAHDEFEKAHELDPSFTEALIMAKKADELTDLVFLAGSNLEKKNYKVVTDIVKNALEVDPNNDFVNRMLFYYRGMAFYEMGEKAKCDRDYVEYQRLDKILN